MKMKGNAVLPSHWAAGALGYVAVVSLLGKLGRVLELSSRLGSLQPWAVLPAVLGQDLMLVAAIGLLAHALARLPRAWLRWTLTVLLLAPIAILAPADVVSHVLTGTPLTMQRLRGDEGGTVAHLHLIDTFELVGGVLGIALALLALWPALRFGYRIPWLARWARLRALMVTLLLGCALSLLQAEFVPRVQGLDGQPVLVMLDSMIERPRVRGIVLSDQEWEALFEPTIKSSKVPRAPHTSGAPPKNVVVFLAEGIPFRHTGFDARFAKGKPPNPTPNLLRLHARHGLLFDRYYTNWHASIQAIFSIVCSQHPPLSGDIVRVKPRIDCGEFSEVMHDHGIVSGLFHGGEFAFYNKLALLGRRKYAIERDAPELARTSKRKKHEWGIDDRAMVDGMLAWVDTLPREQPFAALMIPITAHYPYWTPPDWKRRIKGGSREGRFLNAVAFQDQVFADLVRGFQERNLYDDTLFIWLGDHGHYVGEPERITGGLRGFYEPNLHTPLLFINSRMFGSLSRSARKSARLGSHVDLLPTILHALGKDPDRRHEGQSLLGDEFREKRMFFGATDGKYVGFTEGSYKFVVDTHKLRTEYYDLSKDPDEKKDLSEKFPDRMRHNTQVALMFARGVTGRIDAAPLLREKVSVDNLYELFAMHAALQLTHGDPKVVCVPGKDAGCPGAPMRVETAKALGAKRRCVMVDVPDTGEVAISVKQRDTLDMLTGTLAVLARGKGKVRLETSVDGALRPPVYLDAQREQRLSHPRGQREIRFAFSRATARAPARAPAAAPASTPATVCLQLTTLAPK